ncbi:MAG: hypothetical protein JJ903_12775 [Spongiibacter sp.]|nr:hypothetical protein [Spongiibacter sp.]
MTMLMAITPFGRWRKAQQRVPVERRAVITAGRHGDEPAAGLLFPVFKYLQDSQIRKFSSQ